MPKNGDFIVDDKYVFETGGKSKTRKQIIDLKNANMVSYDIEHGFKNKNSIVDVWVPALEIQFAFQH